MNRLVLLAAALPLNLLAHPGHGPTEHGAAHFIASPYHLAMLVVTAAICLAIARLAAAPAVKRIFYSVSGTALIAAAAALWALAV